MSTYSLEIGDDVLITDSYGDELGHKEAEQVIQRLNAWQRSQKSGVVYLMYSPDIDLYKIGITSKHPDIRRREIAARRQLSAIEIIKVHQCKSLAEAETKERLLHQVFRSSNRRSVSYQDITKDLGQEWFELTSEDVSFIKASQLFVPYQDGFTFNPMAFYPYTNADSEVARERLCWLIMASSELLGDVGLLTAQTKREGNPELEEQYQ